MDIIKLHDDVYEINNFLTNEELDEVYKIINNLKEEDWFSEEEDNKDFWYGKNLEFYTKTVFDKINDKLESLFESYSFYPTKMLLQRYKKGDFIKPHTDQWIPDLGYYIGYGLCLYYNDNYDGGQLEYPDLGLTVKPKKNSLYIHGGHILHGSKPVLSNDIRYFSTVFVHGTDEKPTKLKKEIFQ
jgi:alkylated DNA repair dioxygenase AlkB